MSIARTRGATHESHICRYNSKCNSRMIYKDIVEEYPKCRVEMVSSCPKSMKKCMKVKVMRCSIARRKVRKGQQESICSRVPSKVCGTVRCTKQEQCYPTVKMVTQIRPEEDCYLTRRRVCMGASGVGGGTGQASEEGGGGEDSLP